MSIKDLWKEKKVEKAPVITLEEGLEAVPLVP